MHRLLDRREAAPILQISVRTFERGTEPQFCRLGPLVRYCECDLEEWLGRSLQGSTSDLPAGFPLQRVRCRTASKHCMNFGVQL